MAQARGKVTGEHVQVVGVGLVLGVARGARPSLCTVPEDTVAEDRMGPRKPCDSPTPASQHSEPQLWSLTNETETWSPSLALSTSCLTK